MGFFGVKFGSSVAVVQGPPGTPADLSATATEPNSIDLAWTLSTDYPREKGVRVYSSADGVTYRAHGADLPAGTESLSVGELLPGQTYYFKVSALGTRIESARSSAASATTDSDTPPVAAFSLESTSVVAGSTVLTTNLSADYTASQWFIDDTLVSTEDAPALPFDTAPFNTAGDHSVYLTVTGPGGTDTSDPQIVTVTDPVTPTVESVVALSDRFEVNTDVAVTGHTGFAFHTATHDVIPATYSAGDSTGTKLVFLRDSGVTYRGESPHLDYTPGDVVSASGSVPLAAFTGWVIDNQSDEDPPAPTLPTLSSLTFSSAGNTLVLVASEPVTGTAAPTLSVSGGAAMATYLSGSGTDTITYSLSRTVLQGETATAAMAGGLSDSDGHPLQSFSGTSVTNDSTATASAPGQPTALEAVAGSDTQVVLAWTLADALDTSVTVERSASGADTYSTLATLPGGTRLYTDTGPLAPGTTYDYRVRASNATGDSAWRTVSCATAAAGHRSDLALAAFSAAAQSPAAFRVRLSWTAPTVSGVTSMRVIVYRSSDGGVTFTKVRSQSASSGLSYTWDDYPLAPGTTYHYRARVISPFGYGAYSSASATTDAQGGLPNVPTGLGKAELSTTQCVLTWTDTNGGAASYLIETAPIPGSGVPDSATWTQVAETAAGATSYTLTTAARTCRYWRLRAKNGSGNSEYTKPRPDLTIRPPSGDAAATIDIGPGQAYESVAAAQSAIHALGKGSTVRIHGRATAYAELFLLACRGTTAEPITVEGVDDGDGYPVLDGYEAVAPADFLPGNGTTFWAFGVLLVHRRSADAAGYQPGHLVVRNLTLRRASVDNSPVNTFTDPAGNPRTWSAAGSGCYIASGDNILFDGCSFLDNGNGAFAAADSTDVRYCADLTFRGCYFAGNGQSGGSFRHQSYVEAVRTTYECCWYGDPRAGSYPSQIKDRGPGTVIRYCRIDPAIRTLDIVESQNNFDRTYLDPAYHVTHVYGNLIRYNTSNPNHYGGDSALPPFYRGGQLRFYHNTVVADPAASPTFRTTWFYCNSPTDAVCAVNNVVYVAGSVGEFNLGTDNAGTDDAFVGVYGPNFVRSDWQSVKAGNTFSGLAHGTAAFLSNSGNLPDFVDRGAGNYAVLESTLSHGAGGRLPSDWLPADREYVHPRSSQARASWGGGSDLGFAAASPDTNDPTVTAAAIDSFGGTLTLTFSERVSSTGTGYSLSATGGALTATYSGGSGTDTLTFSLSRTVLVSETVTRSYDSGAGDTTDLATSPNALASFTGQAVTNGSEETSDTGPGVKGATTFAPTGTVSTVTLDKPPTAADGDVFEVGIYTSGSATVTPPSGWVLDQDQADGFASGRLRVYTKPIPDAGAEPASYDFTLSAATYAMAALARVTGADSADPVDASAKGAGTSSTTQASPSVTTTGADRLILRWLAIDRSYDVTAPAAHVRKVHLSAPLQYGGRLALAVAAQADAGPTGAADFTLSTARPAAMVTAALNPEAA